MILKKLFIILFFLFIGLIEVKANADTGNCTPPFTDVSCDHWAINYISAVKDAGITKGCNPPQNDRFCPEDVVTRAQMAAFIIRAIEGEPTNYNGTPYFADVSPMHWAFKYVQRVKERGIAQGYPGTNLYGPEDNVTREQMAKMLIMGLVSQGKTSEPPTDYCSTGAPFDDVSASSWSCRYIKKLKELGITQGCNPPEYDRYCPQDGVTRAQMATFIYRGFLSNSSNSSVGAMMLSSGPFGAIMVGKGGEVLLPIVERDASGNPVKVTGALYMNGEIGNNLLVYFDNDGRPAKAFMGDFIILFSNWSADNKTVDIAIIYTLTDYIEIVRGVKVNTNSTMKSSSAFLQNFSQLTTHLSNDTSRQLATYFIDNNTVAKNIAEMLKRAGLGVSLVSCLTAGPATFYLSCGGFLISTATFLMGDEAWLGLQGLEAGFSANDGFECLGGNIWSCVSYISYVGAELLDSYNKLNNEESRGIEIASTTLAMGNNGIIQLGNGTPPVLPPKYECIPGGSMDWEPCLLGGARKCQPDYTYGPCMCNNGTTLCEYCGDGHCNKLQGENSITCPSDCPPVCGNGICEKGEKDTCPSDCPPCELNRCYDLCLNNLNKCYDYCNKIYDPINQTILVLQCMNQCDKVYFNCPSYTDPETCTCVNYYK